MRVCLYVVLSTLVYFYTILVSDLLEGLVGPPVSSCNLRTRNRNEHRISRGGLSEVMKIIYISTNAADLSEHVPGNTNGTCCPRTPIIL